VKFLLTWIVNNSLQITYPKSFLKLLLIGFALAMLPLLVAFANANLYFGKLSKQSLFNMSQAVETTRASRILIEELAVMERSARQYFVLHDKLLLTNYLHAHERFNKAINDFSQLPMAKPLTPDLSKFSKQEISLFTSISQAPALAAFNQNMVDSFASLSSQANKIINENNNLIDKESANFKAKVSHTQQVLFWQTLTLIPLAILIAGLITWMIARPIRRMDAAIHQLGQGNYEHDIKISGPGDLRQLGFRLNWLRTELKDLHQQKQRFLQQASHELKTPLTAIREASELLNDGVVGKLNQQQNEVIAILRDNSLRLQKMIENLLSYTEIQFNSLQLNVSKITLKDSIKEVTQAYALTIATKNISLNVNIDDITLQADNQKLRTVLDNLVSNAVKFTPNMGEIHIHATQSKSMITIEIIDTGPGIGETNQHRLFDPFYRGEQSHNGLIAGSGLGLFIAKEAVNALKGEIILVPTHIGAHFKLQLPNSEVFIGA
jgi:two-component system, NtrC family, sensor histidine kinase GlrK